MDIKRIDDTTAECIVYSDDLKEYELSFSDFSNASLTEKAQDFLLDILCLLEEDYNFSTDENTSIYVKKENDFLSISITSNYNLDYFNEMMNKDPKEAINYLAEQIQRTLDTQDTPDYPQLFCLDETVEDDQLDAIKNLKYAYIFNDIDTLIKFSKVVSKYNNVDKLENELYKIENSKYMLVFNKLPFDNYYEINSFLNSFYEYADEFDLMDSSIAHYIEHGKLIIKNPIQELSNL